MKDYLKELQFAVTISNKDNKIVYMNDKSAETFSAYGGAGLTGSNLLDCHPGESKRKLIDLIESEDSNIYITEKEGRQKLIIQAPLFENGVFDGLCEISIPLPEDIPVYQRK